MILLERPASGPTNKAAQAPRYGSRSAALASAHCRACARVTPLREPARGQRPRAGGYQSQQTLKPPRPLRPTRLYRLIQTQPGAAISLALGPHDQEEAPIASLAKEDRLEPAISQRGQAIASAADGKRHQRNWNIGQLLRFAITGGLNTVIDILVLNALIWLLNVKSTPLLLACNIIAYCAGAVNSFLLNKYWTFDTQEPISGGELWRFALITLSGSLWSSSILWLAGLALQHVLVNPALWANAAKVVAIGGTALISYLGLRLWVFVQRRPEASLPRAHRFQQQARCSQWETLPDQGYQPSASNGPTATTATTTPHADHTQWMWKGPETL
ncbi:GtrA family protein [Thermogemmatispora sp.]|uniref:GtrA family protein n=1 Tax=Thermogemmatispora sp. TaxID=1968838 RepID=UPI001D8A677B|nr:GtrA family protein [Thermogemmatispora sp.]MBX5449797.1 GtrA family protein [Thermogemmatispora sp.]